MKRERKVRRVTGYLLWGLVGILVLFVLYLIVCNVRGKVAFVGKYAVVRIVSASMEPTIPTGEYILVKKTAAEDVEIDDVLLFVSEDPALGGEMNTHRVIGLTTEGGFITKGDNNTSQDSYSVPKENVVGVYVDNIEGLTKVATLAKSKLGYFLLILVPGLILIGMAVSEIVKKAKENN